MGVALWVWVDVLLNWLGVGLGGGGDVRCLR